MKFLNYKSCLAFIFLLGISFGACNSERPGVEATILKINYTPGDKFLYTITQSQNINSMGVANIDQEMTIEMAYEMMQEEDGYNKLAITFEHIALRSNGTAGEIAYDSQDPDSSSLLKDMGRMVGKRFYALFDKEGNLQNVRESSVNEKPGEAFEPEMEKFMDDSTLTVMLRNNFNIYPGKAVKVGEKWHKNSEMNVANFTIQMKNTYTLQSVTNGVAIISTAAELNLPGSTISQGGYKMKVEMRGEQSGTVEMDVQSGRILSEKNNMEIEGKIKSAGQELPMKIKSEMKAVSKKL